MTNEIKANKITNQKFQGFHINNRFITRYSFNKSFYVHLFITKFI